MVAMTALLQQLKGQLHMQAISRAKMLQAPLEIAAMIPNSTRALIEGKESENAVDANSLGGTTKRVTSFTEWSNNIPQHSSRHCRLTRQAAHRFARLYKRPLS